MKKWAYYNEREPYCVDWLRGLISRGLIMDGEVDGRDIREVRSADIDGFVRYHFFAGIAGWDLALRLAGWPEDREVWTGSAPCQPFSSAGKRLGFADERHLWPAWRDLIAERHPPVVFGEQVARASEWLALVRGDLESMGYAVGCVPIEAASVGARHLRDRYWLVAHADGAVADPNGASEDSYAPPSGPRGATGERGVSGGGPLAHADGKSPLGPAVAWPERDPWLVEPDVGRVVARLPEHVDQLRAIGNSVVPQCAAAFVAAAMACLA